MSLDRDQLLAEMGLTPRWGVRQQPPVGRSARQPAVMPAAVRDAPQARGVTAAVAALPLADAAQRASDEVPGEVVPGEDSAPSSPPVAVTAPVAAPADDERAARIAQFDWTELRRSVAECAACTLCAERRQAVPGVGDENADWLFIGEGPGAEEDARGEPFVGPAGKLLDAMLNAIGLERGTDVYIANAVKCRPPGNRTPEADEAAACAPYLRRQIALLKPRLIVLLGRAAVHALLGEAGSLASLRGKPLTYRAGDREIPVVVTYHPAYLLRSLPDKAKSWEDLCRARAMMRAAKAAASPAAGDVR